eukprot:CAMPEP_0113322162 /NCGR_PEP_ID=MMETSP0010_2-20120614/15424_1 /TAXON_ID=216773 ORGANISM="Corethron hystrix, Strain 308" /NCGR_SAMPLE_ID=MMETSP0010_2 /ASSEMBLY_ACC=CAM_ASM_000155 /LENGTH=339 /DNA_ID=CAMNT_0000180575 /DNA_START=150 /DNA_END=1172 /DNA_ORIENTATION=+ /assembly_acc=CAM_ASM_000155
MSSTSVTAKNIAVVSSRTALAQLRSTNVKADNLAAVVECARLAKEGGASFLCLPECFAFMGSSPGETADAAEDIFEHLAPDGKPRTKIFDTLKNLAIEHGLWISAGGMHERTRTGDGMVHNSHFVLRPDGSLAGLYRKCHLFDVFIPSRNIDLRESATTTAGTVGTVIVRDTPIGSVGLTTCYDVRFPEMYASLLDAGADVVLVPSAFTVPTGAAHWHILLRARAAEGQCYILAAAQAGVHSTKRRSYGHSLVVDPWGEVVADAGGYDGLGSGRKVVGGKSPLCISNEHDEPVPTPSVVFCDLDPEMIKLVRERIPISNHRAACPADYGEISTGLEDAS